MCLIMVMVMCNKQHLSNIWSRIHEKVKQHWGWVEKSAPYKKACILSKRNRLFLQILEIIQRKAV